MDLSTVTQKGQLTIPVDVMDLCGFLPSTGIHLSIEDMDRVIQDSPYDRQGSWHPTTTEA